MTKAPDKHYENFIPSTFSAGDPASWIGRRRSALGGKFFRFSL